MLSFFIETCVNNVFFIILLIILLSILLNCFVFFFDFLLIKDYKILVFYNLITLYVIHILVLLTYLYFDFSSFPYYSSYLNSSFSFNLMPTFVYMDGISILFLLLLTFLMPICLLLHIYYNMQIFFFKLRKNNLLNLLPFSKNTVFFIIMLFFLEAVLFFFFLSADLFNFYIFFEMSMLPLYFMIGLFGSRVNRIKASYYLFFFTVIGSIFFFIGLLFLIYLFGSSDIIFLSNVNIPVSLQKPLWLMFFIPLSVKIPIFPLHVWLPEAHVEAPTEGSVLLAGLLLKLGLFGIIRFLIPIFPDMVLFFNPLISVFAIIGIIYTSCIIFIQLDLKKIIAYSSITHMNFALLGLFSNNLIGIQGSVYMMFTHGIISSGLFIIIGSLYSRYNTRMLAYYQGLNNNFPVLSFFFFVFTLGNLGLPGTGGFIGEFLIFLGIINHNLFVGILSLFSPLLGAIFSILLFVRIFYGIQNLLLENFFFKSRQKKNVFVKIQPIVPLEFFILAYFSFFLFLTGLFPNIYLNAILLSCINLIY